MSLRRAGGSTLRLLRVYALQHGALEQFRGLQAAAVHLPAVSQHLITQRSTSYNGSQWWEWQVQQVSLYHLRHLTTGTDRKDETTKPGAEECDEAIEHYARARSSYQNLRPPSTYKTASQRIMDIIAAASKGTIAVLAWLVSVPGRLWSLRTWSGEDWSKWWQGIKKIAKEEAHHYWVGFKLLAVDVRVASGLMLKAARGNTLTRRERRQLTRTTADLFRLVPMVIILVVPFLEFLLPVLLKLFPNMLPSTFEDKLKKEEEVKKRLVLKMEVAKFLQDTVAEMAKDIKSKRTGEMSASAAELYTFINKVRAGREVSNDELVRFASLFNDELTLDNLDRVQLVSMCQLLGIQPYGTDGFLRNRLRSHLDMLKQDDLLIRQEGLESLTDDELRTACKARGMKAAFGEGATMYMQRQMKNWLDLSLNRGLPSSLLLLSRAFTLTGPVPKMAVGLPGGADELGRVKETLLTLPEEVIKDVGLEVAAPTTSAEELQKRLHLIQKEQKLIQAEAEQAELEQEAVAAAEPAAAAGPSSTVGAEDTSAGLAAQHAAAVAAATAVFNEASAGALRDVIGEKGISPEERAANVASSTAERMRELLGAITVLTSSSGVAAERAQFMDLVRQQVQQLQDTHGTAGPSLAFTGGSLQAVRPEDETVDNELIAPLRLEQRVDSILRRLEKELDQADAQIGERLHVLDLDNDGLITADELQNALRFLKANLPKEDLLALLDKLEIKAEGGTDKSIIPVADLIKLAEQAPAPAATSSSSSSKPIVADSPTPKQPQQHLL